MTIVKANIKFNNNTKSSNCNRIVEYNSLSVKGIIRKNRAVSNSSRCSKGTRDLLAKRNKGWTLLLFKVKNLLTLLERIMIATIMINSINPYYTPHHQTHNNSSNSNRSYHNNRSKWSIKSNNPQNNLSHHHHHPFNPLHQTPRSPVITFHPSPPPSTPFSTST